LQVHKHKGYDIPKSFNIKGQPWLRYRRFIVNLL
jgi:hypothetical protein